MKKVIFGVPLKVIPPLRSTEIEGILFKISDAVPVSARMERFFTISQIKAKNLNI